MSDDRVASTRDRALREQWRKACAVGLRGIARRIDWRLQGRARARGRALWRARYLDAPGDDAALARRFEVAPAELDGVLRALLAPPDRAFWFDAEQAGLRDAFLLRHAADAARIADQAQAARRGDLSWVVPGGVPDWHAALPGGERWPLTPSDEIAIGAATPLGDVRLAWEIGRCSHLVRIAQAAWLARDAALARVALEGMLDFAGANPPGLGIAWAHAQEVALRAVAWLHCLELLRPFDLLDGAARRRLAWQLLAHADYVACHLANAPTTHNHLVSECFGMFSIGVAMPGLPGAAGLRARGARLLWRELLKQVDEDGVHAEGSTHYHAFVLDSAIAALLLADRAGLAVPSAVRARIGAMADTLASWLRADGSLPAIGDTDAGRGWRLGLDPLDRRDLLAAAAVAFDRRDWGALAGDASGAFWLTGGRDVPGAGSPPAACAARRFEDGGIGVVRRGWGADFESLLFRAGRTRFRPDVLTSHMHADALSVLWRIGDEDVLLDPGTYLYSEGEGFRVALRRTAAHSCVVLDGRDQADVTSQRFGLSGETPARWLAFDADAHGLRAAAEHPAESTPRVRRRLAWIPGRSLVLCDDVLGRDAHQVESWLQLPAARGVASGAEARLELPTGRALLVQVAGDAAGIEVVRPAATDGPGPGWRAPRYGLRSPGTALRIDAGLRELPLRLVTVIQIAKGAEPARAEILRDAGGDGVRVEARDFCVHFGSGATASIEPRP